MRKIIYTAIYTCLIIGFANVRAQVTIGINDEAPKGTLLEVRDKKIANPKTDNQSVSKGGLILPRIALTDLRSLEPLVDPSDSDYANQKKLHVGTMVYNTTKSDAKLLFPGIYTWDGNLWSYLVKEAAGMELNYLTSDLTYPSGRATQPIVPQQVKVEWKPADAKCTFTKTDLLKGGVKIINPSPLPSGLTGGTHTFNISLGAFLQSEVNEDPFLEKVSNLNATISDIDGIFTKKILLRQIHYSLLVGEYDDKPELGKSYTIKIRSNSKWKATVSSLSTAAAVTSFTATGATNTVLGSDFTYTLAPDDQYEGQMIEFTFSSTDDAGVDDHKFQPVKLQIVTQREYPNSYLVTPASNFKFSVKKAYKVWDQDLSTNLVGKSWNVELFWQDEQDLIKSVKFESGDQGVNSMIEVQTNNDPTPKTGNAIIALKDAVSGDIYWSWHLWITNYNPNNVLSTEANYDSPVHTASATVEGGNIWGYYGGNVKYYWMDRNMGSTTMDMSDIRSAGKYYQWGRKDPLPALAHRIPADWITAEALYDINNNAILGDIGTNAVAAVAGRMLEQSIKEPLRFIRGADTNDKDWYSADANVKNDYMWTTAEGLKGLYDPCPEGWRVPSGSSSKNPLGGITWSTPIAGQGQDYSMHKFGTFPYNGTVLASSAIYEPNKGIGLFLSTGIGSLTWLLQCSPSATVIYLATDERAEGRAIRCVRDDRK